MACRRSKDVGPITSSSWPTRPVGRRGAFVVREGFARAVYVLTCAPSKKSVFVATALPELRLSFDARPHSASVLFAPAAVRFVAFSLTALPEVQLFYYCRVVAAVSAVVAYLLLRHFYHGLISSAVAFKPLLNR